MKDGEPRAVEVFLQCGRFEAWRGIVPPEGVCLTSDPSSLVAAAKEQYYIINGRKAPVPRVTIEHMGEPCLLANLSPNGGKCNCYFQATATPPTSSQPPESRAS